MDATGLTWLSLEGSAALVNRWIEAGHRGYGGLALLPPEGGAVRRGEFAEGVLPPWVDQDNRARDVFVSFSHSDGGAGQMASCKWGYVLDNLSALLWADGDGYAVVTPGLESVLLVNVTDEEAVVGIDAWGDFLLDAAGG